MKDYNVENENTEYTGFSADGAPSPKKPKKHTGAKIVAYLAAIALVSGGSISAYFGSTSFSHKWLNLFPDTLLERDKQSFGVCRARLRLM